MSHLLELGSSLNLHVCRRPMKDLIKSFEGRAAKEVA